MEPNEDKDATKGPEDQDVDPDAPGEGGDPNAPAGEDGREPGEGQDAPSGLDDEQVAALFADPRAAEMIQTGFRQALQSLKGDEDAQKQQAEINGLVQEGNFEELGKRYAQTLTAARQRAQVAQEVRGQFYTGLFGQVVAGLPELKNLSDEDKKHLDPSGYQSDDAYLAGLFNFVADKRSAATGQTKAHELLASLDGADKAKEAAAANEAAGRQPTTPAASPSGAPAGNSSQLLATAFSGEPDNEE